MALSPKKAAEWRIEFAREMSQYYTENKNVRTIVLGGSPSRGLSDDYSDIDMVVYWDPFDSEFVENSPLKKHGGELNLVMRNPDGTIGMELYYFDTLIFEVGHITLNEWNQITSEVIDHHDCSPHKIKTIGGFYDAIPLYGDEFYSQLRKNLEIFPRDLAVKMVVRNLGFFWKGCILHQGIQRNEIVFYHDAFCMTIKRLMGVLSGLNHHYFSAVEPRWIEYELKRMTIKPDKMWERIVKVFQLKPETGVRILEQLISETVNLVKIHMPEADLTQFNESDALVVRATRKRPDA